MPAFTQPAGGRLREFNKCHSPKGPGGGQFCDDEVPSSHETVVGVTSYRAPDQPGAGDRTNASTFARMHELTADLRAKGLEVDARPAQGAWAGAWEPAWAVGINAGENWDASAVDRTMAAYGKKFNQDAVLLMHQCLDDCNSEYAEMAFDGGVDRTAREPINAALAAAGMGGWTWYKGTGGKTTLRIAYVPAWAERSLAEHQAAVKAVYAGLQSRGYTMVTSRSRVRVEVFERDARTPPVRGVRSYDEVLRGRRDAEQPLERGPNVPPSGWPMHVWEGHHGYARPIQTKAVRR